MKRLVIAGIVFSLLISSFEILVPQRAYAGDKEESIAVAVAEYLISGRAVIAKNQALINDASKGDKGFTPAAYEAQVRQEFLARTKMDITLINKSMTDDFSHTLYAVHTSAKEVIGEAQSQINEQGKAFKGFNPAVYGARTGKKLKERTDVTLKQTSIRYRGDYNKPDEFETAVLKKFETGERGKPHFEDAVVDGKKSVRYMFPLYIEQSCLTCHGDPAGEKDVSGRIKEGYKLGDTRGAISVTVPVR